MPEGHRLGNPTYNIYRSDIATLFPGYANSNGSAGYFYLDTTAYSNGVHTIQWTVTDNAGNTDGIGSRYFTIENSGVSSQQSLSLVSSHWSLGNEDLSSIPINIHEPVIIRKGCKTNRKINEIYPGDNDITTIEIKELERVEIQVSPGTSETCGYMVVGNQLRPLPIGSTFDQKSGIFYWQPGVGFYGTYEFVFIKVDGTDQRKLKVKILPKHLNPRE